VTLLEELFLSAKLTGLPSEGQPSRITWHLLEELSSAKDRTSRCIRASSTTTEPSVSSAVNRSGKNLRLYDTTFSSNHAGNVTGAVFSNNSIAGVQRCTFYDNSLLFNTGAGNAIFFQWITSANFGNNIFTEATDPLGVDYTYGAVNSDGYNIFTASQISRSQVYNDGSQTPSDQVGVLASSLALVALQDNGGSTFTHTLQAGSVVIDAGDPGFSCAHPCYDQHGEAGFDRVVGERVDVGAIEYIPPIPSISMSPISPSFSASPVSPSVSASISKSHSVSTSRRS
jgi:hypothetical protein